LQHEPLLVELLELFLDAVEQLLLAELLLAGAAAAAAAGSVSTRLSAVSPSSTAASARDVRCMCVEYGCEFVSLLRRLLQRHDGGHGSGHRRRRGKGKGKGKGRKGRDRIV